MEQRQIEVCIVDGLKEFIKLVYKKDCEVVRANQTAPVPSYPYISYSIIPFSADAKKWSKAEDGTLYRPLTQTWSLTVQSDDEDEANEITQLAFYWFDVLSATYLSDNEIVVERVMNVSNRDNMITIEYEHRRGFDVRLSIMHKIDASIAEPSETIETIEL